MFHHERAGRKKARSLISRTGYAAGGHLAETKSDYASDKRMVEAGVHAHERAMHPGERETKLKLADGGVAEGDMSAPRGDKGHRGKSGAGKGKTHVNILIAPQDKADGGGALPTAPPPPAMLPPPPPRPMGPPPGAMPPGGPPGMPPGMPPRPMPPMAPPTGNAPMGVGAPQGGTPPLRPPVPMPPPPGGMPMRKAGGRAGYHPPDMKAGAGSGSGRLEKIGRD